MDSEVDPDSPSAPGSDPPTYPVVALGGTFDHLHAGHKILLSMAAWIADEKLIVGVTGTCRSDDEEETCSPEPMFRRHASDEKGQQGCVGKFARADTKRPPVSGNLQA